MLGMNLLSTSHVVIGFYRRAILLQVLNQAEFEFFGSRILETTLARARPIGATFATLYVRERQILVVSDFIDMFSE